MREDLNTKARRKAREIGGCDSRASTNERSSRHGHIRNHRRAPAPPLPHRQCSDAADAEGGCHPDPATRRAARRQHRRAAHLRPGPHHPRGGGGGRHRFRQDLRAPEPPHAVEQGEYPRHLLARGGPPDDRRGGGHLLGRTPLSLSLGLPMFARRLVRWDLADHAPNGMREGGGLTPSTPTSRGSIATALKSEWMRDSVSTLRMLAHITGAPSPEAASCNTLRDKE